MNKTHLPPTAEKIRSLFTNNEPEPVWDNAVDIVKRIHPDIDLAGVRLLFDDVLRLFSGTYPDYDRIQTPYHDLPHTLAVFICAVRTLHGVHLARTHLSAEEIQMILCAALLHDIGYAQKISETAGTGAQHTRTHIQRGIAFMAEHIHDWQLPPAWVPELTSIIDCTSPGHGLSKMRFSSDRIRLLGQIVASGDLIGQMADRTYLEKLLFLHLEFEEANLELFKDAHDLLEKTREFYDFICTLIDSELGGVFHHLNYHFKDYLGADCNFYLTAIEGNIEYLDKVITLNPSEWFSMFKRHGIVQAYQEINQKP